MASEVDITDPAFGGPVGGVWNTAFLNAADSVPGNVNVVIPPGGYDFDSVDLGTLPAKRLIVHAHGARLTKVGSADHMFKDTANRIVLQWFGGLVGLSSQNYTLGDTVSFYFGIRANDLHFVDLTIFDGIEEGLKLWKPLQVVVDRCRFFHIKNNGVHVHAPQTDVGFTGTTPDRDSEDVIITNSMFFDIDDGKFGTADGQGVAISGASTSFAAKNVVVANCIFEDCIRGIWAEFNQANMPGRNILFTGNVVKDSKFHGIGLVGTEASAVTDNTVINAGSQVPDPPNTSDETFGIKLSGSGGNRGRANVVTGNTIIDNRSTPLTQYGVKVVSQVDGRVADNVVAGPQTPYAIPRQETITSARILVVGAGIKRRA